jgi:hypothetical protein
MERRKCKYASSKYELLLTVLIPSYQFVDKIIRAAIEMSPHTSPNARFPVTNDAHRRSLEAGKFRIPLDFQYQLRRPSAEYLIDDDD